MEPDKRKQLAKRNSRFWCMVFSFVLMYAIAKAFFEVFS